MTVGVPTPPQQPQAIPDDEQRCHDQLVQVFCEMGFEELNASLLASAEVDPSRVQAFLNRNRACPHNLVVRILI